MVTIYCDISINFSLVIILKSFDGNMEMILIYFVMKILVANVSISENNLR